jgi:steroid delta-isomerase-like uncharacterized protein
MSAENKALVRRWFHEVWNQGRESAIDEILAAGALGHGLGEADVETKGPEGFKPFLRNLRGAMPDLKVRIEDMIAEDDKVVVRIVAEGTHQGAHLGVPPTGKAVRIQGIVVLRMQDGKIAEGWNSWDQLGLMRQIGALQAPAGQDRFLTARPE